ncbi:uncharacterized protein PV07_06225 [Cladophialophora immunda]|uniref:Xylanolytic transcriptional activator regulatory domain-containing protein n=1 Tax=Cladophialophora immunda TaxID=569365 RepID=A0A0D2CHA4_9EURO|nr:uncharacterized protein PV07_06225 [Cladophialophora immunda]KIW30483.1 hypothetical protein PV07_06225 [Cladophialophora immunda]
MTFCLPWMPIVERSWLEEKDHFKPSPLLLQSVFLAGSRVASGLLPNISSEDFYRRAKALFYCGYEKNRIINIVSLCLLHWWSPAGPEELPADNSDFWLSIGVRYAYQVGLHKQPTDGKHAALKRRIWWTLVARDCMISASLGRPRTICLEDCDVSPPSLRDFSVQGPTSRLYVAYVGICQIMGDIAEHRMRQKLSGSPRVQFENALYRWVKDLPPELRLFHHGSERTLSSYNFQARQLLIHYFVSLVMLFGSSDSQRKHTATCLLASSFICGIFQDFLARGELRYLRVNFAFLSLAAGLSQLTGYRYSALRSLAEHEIDVIKLSLQELSVKWRSAKGALKSLVDVASSMSQQPQWPEPCPKLSSTALLFFEDFGPELCEAWSILVGQDRLSNSLPTTSLGACRAATDHAEHFEPSTSIDPTVVVEPPSVPDMSFDSPCAFGHQGVDGLHGQVAPFWPGWDSSGTWLLTDLNDEGLW